MIWADRLPKLGGLVLLLLCVGIIVSAVMGMTVTSNDPFTRGDARGYLQDLDKHKTEFIIGLIATVIVDAGLGILAAATLFTLLRDRAGALATAALVLVISATAVFMVADGVSAVLVNIARDFTKGGPPGVDAASAQTLEVGRALAMVQGAAEQVGSTALTTGILVFGAIVAWAPLGKVNPPRWLGIVAVISGFAGYLAWLIVLSDAAFLIFIITTLGQLIFLAGTGLWLVSRPEAEAAAMRTSAA